MACAPVSDVAVPATHAPCRASSRAMAWPIPRLAPVTSAILLSKGCIALRSAGASELQQLHGVLDGDGLGLRGDALVQRGQHAARPAFDDAGHALLGEAADDFNPAHGRVHLT